MATMIPPKRPTMPVPIAPGMPGGAPIAGVGGPPVRPEMPATPPVKPTMPPTGLAGPAVPGMMMSAAGGPPPGVPGPPPPGVPPAPPTPAPAAPFTPTTEQQQTAVMPAGSFGDDSPDAGKMTGDPYLDDFRSGRFAGSEDWRRFSNKDLLAWKPYYVGNGKFKNKYGDIVDKPFERGPNTPAGVNGMGVPGNYGGGGGGAGGAGGMGGGGKLPPKQPGEMAGASDTIWQAILGRLQGGSRYTPEAMQGMMGALKASAEAQATNQQAESNADLAARGLARSSIGAGQALSIRQNVGNQMLQANAAMQKAKIDADFQDKSAAIEEGINWLNSMRDYVARMAATEAQKQAAMANIELGYAQLRQQTDMMREQYAQQLQMYGLGM